MFKGELAADHAVDHLLFADRSAVPIGDPLAIAEADHVVGNLLDLIQTVRDIDDRGAILLQQPDLFENPRRIGLAQRCGRFVEDHIARLAQQSLADLDSLLNRHRQPPHHGGRIDVHAKRPQDFTRLADHVRPVDASPFGWLTSKEDILGHRQFGQQADFLMDQGNAVVNGLCRRLRRIGCTVQPHLTGRTIDDPRDDVVEGGFPGAVFADQGHDLPGQNREFDSFQNFNRTVTFAKPAAMQTGRERCAV